MEWNHRQSTEPENEVYGSRMAKTENEAIVNARGVERGTDTPPVYRTYKDRVFRLLFNNRKRLLELYNALNGSHYANEEELTINTLENAVYMKMKNDISFIVESNMCLYEHQSGYCPNMPLRGLFYFSDLYKKLLKDVDLSVRKRIRIPSPRYVVFYNGLERKEEELIQKLSESYEDGNEGCMEITVHTININRGHNRSLLEKSPSLYGYSFFVSLVREKMERMKLNEAVESAVEECIRKDILKDFLLEQKAEVVAMSIYEYNEEYAKKANFEAGEEEGYERGREAGREEGLEAGQARLNRLNSILIDQNREADLVRAVKDKEYQEKLLEELGI